MTTFPIRLDSAGGEYMEDALVVGWSVRPGDAVKAGQLLVTVETAKAATEIEAERDGWLAEIFYAVGQEAPVGVVLGTLADAPPASISASSAREHPQADVQPYLPPASAADSATPPTPASVRRPASPLARRTAHAAGLDLADISGTGPRGRIKQRDVLARLATRDVIPASVAATTLPEAAPARRPAPVVLLHGFGADRSSWRQVTPLLAASLPAGTELLALDLPGHGSEAGRPAMSIESMALDLSARLDAAGLEQAHLVGHSLGGAAAIMVCALGRLAVRSLTLIAPGGLGPEINAGFLAGLAEAATPEALGRWLAEMVGEPGTLPAGFARAAFAQREQAGNRATLAGLAGQLFAGGTQGFDLAAELARVTAPTRLIWGRADRIVPAAHAARAPGFAAVHLLDGIGHVPQLEDPALTARLIAETVRSAG
ncbi:alpha/beta fold hydrolase [Ancylobacter sp. WKF20]|uniref:alpha/beta fold hydrolase n=1 Tax=Ancylobacter sp. WKF20 TaxID=3039801 RepID=UPI0024342D7A|nr:alpha/beta fold hydrolase [Ancylobacter sp. WKF20]WGD28338.1 alpha/beta fold hydrolase [Ancylobacter sp. WKF20]